MGSLDLKRLFVVIFASAALLLAACGDSETVAPTPPPSATPTVVSTEISPAPSAPAAAARLEPDGGRILADVKLLSDNGPRSSATDLERAAADLIAGRLRQLGYEVVIQEFSADTLQGRTSVLTVKGSPDRTIPTFPVDNSPTSQVAGKLVRAGIGRPQDFPPDTRDGIALIERGTLTFEQKVANAAAAGARGAIIYNNEPGIFLAGADAVSIPAVSISQDRGAELAGALDGGDTLSVEVGVSALSGSVSRNVLAKAPGAECETVSGGHYDSVPQAPGASDNASGTATILEIAAILANRSEIGNNCFVLFGAEELGLLGSKYYVSTLDQASKSRIKAMLNFDMVGVGDQAWWLVGNGTLQKRMSDIAAGLGIQTVNSTLTGTSSDHASFLQAGIPALMFHRWEDPLLHTPQDVSSRVKPEYLEQAASMGVALLEAIGTEG
ncbi:MAG TPA: M28 family peptidase [Dehalococcoidia bacterium]|nr:M28 family peptidase [Dehalococcoidia bacterium]